MQARHQRQVLLSKRPEGTPGTDDFDIVDAECPTPVVDEVLIRTQYLSVDPGMRGMMEESGSHAAAFALNQPLTGRSVGRVVESRHPDFAVGDTVLARLPWQNWSVSDGCDTQRIDTDIAPASAWLGVIGVPGICAWFGLHDIGQPRAGETVFVSGAAGAVGMTVVQLARRAGCRVVGTAGREDKIDCLHDELGLDAVIDYKRTDDLRAALADACPDGIDVYFDNVGGDITRAALPLINHGARIVVCGQTSQYNRNSDDASGNSGTIDPHLLIRRSARAQGFVVYDFDERRDEAIEGLGRLIRDGALHYRENVYEGIERAPQAFIDLFSGKSFGKQLVRLSDD